MTTRSMFTPMSAAVSGSWAVARMPRPKRDVATKRSRATIRTMAATMTRTLSVRMLASHTSASWVLFKTLGKPRGLRP